MADSPEKKAEKISTITAAVKAVIDSYAIGHEFYGNQLKDDCLKLIPEFAEAYVDTFLKMARRHRRDSYIAIDHNNSLYKRVKLNTEILQEKIEREQAEEAKKKEQEKNVKKPEQLDLLFTHGFLAFFFAVILGFFFVSAFAFGFDFGGPNSTSLIAAKSSPVYIPVGPTYLKGVLPLRCNRFFTASVDMLPPSALAMSFTVISIPYYRGSLYKNQVENDPNSRKWDILLYKYIAKITYICEISENSFQNLDRSTRFLYTVPMSRMWDTENGTGETGSLNGSIAAKGDFYERLQEFSGMA